MEALGLISQEDVCGLKDLCDKYKPRELENREQSRRLYGTLKPCTTERSSHPHLLASPRGATNNSRACSNAPS